MAEEIRQPAAGFLPGLDAPLVNTKDTAVSAQKKPKIRLSDLQSQKLGTGIRCPKCGCYDLQDEMGPGWETYKSLNIPGARRRYKICRNCGCRVRTVERIEHKLDNGETNNENDNEENGEEIND